jgi:hypothetical protein
MTREQALERIHDPNPPLLSAADQAAFAACLERDAELRAMHDEQQALFALMDAWEDGAEPSADFDRSLWARIEAEPPRTSWAQWVGSWLSWPRAAWASCAVALLVAAAVWIGPRPAPVETQKVAKVEAVAVSAEDAEFLQEIDRALDDMEMLMEFDALAPEGRI